MRKRLVAGVVAVLLLGVTAVVAWHYLAPPAGPRTKPKARRRSRPG